MTTRAIWMLDGPYGIDPSFGWFPSRRQAQVKCDGYNQNEMDVTFYWPVKIKRGRTPLFNEQ